MSTHENFPSRLIDVYRGPFIESGHRGHAVVADANGHVMAVWGNATTEIMPRSAVKALQALALVESGAADAFGVTDREIALACASHSGEDVHSSAVQDWLARMGVGVETLECGAHPPKDRATADRLVAMGKAPTALHNNCSGKHAGFLCTALHLGVDPAGYVGYDHPVQRVVRQHIQAMTDCDPATAPCGTDGCSVPTYAIPIGKIAMAMARLVTHAIDRSDDHGRACARIVKAWGDHPQLIAGTGRFDTDMIRASAGRALTKAGAEGVSCAVVPERRLGIAVKIEDGADRGASAVMAAILSGLGAVDRSDSRIAALAAPALENCRGLEVGRLAPTTGFSDDLAHAFTGDKQ